METIVESLVVSFLVSHLASGASAAAADMETAFGAWVASNPFLAQHKILKAMLTDASTPLISGVAGVLQDTADLKAVIVDLSTKNYAAAAAALLAAVKSSVPALKVAA